MEKRIIWHCATMCHDNWYMLVVVDFVLTRKRLACMIGVFLLRECTNKCLASGSSWSGYYTSFLTDPQSSTYSTESFPSHRHLQPKDHNLFSRHRERRWHYLTISSVRTGWCKVKLGLWATAFFWTKWKVKNETLYIYMETAPSRHKCKYKGETQMV